MKYIFTIILFSSCFCVKAQTANIISVEQKDQKIYITYDLLNDTIVCGLSLYFKSSEKKTNWVGPLKEISGDIDFQYPGKNKLIVWDVLSEMDGFVGDFQFKLQEKDIPEIQAEFPGGNGELYKYLEEQVEYPKYAKKKGIQGEVFVQFIVYNDGTIKDIEVVKGIHKTLNNEAIRVIQSMPKWKPGKQCEKAVNSSFTIPISFQIENYKPKNYGPILVVTASIVVGVVLGILTSY